MRLMTLLRDVFRRAPGVVFVVGLLLMVGAALDALAALSIVPVVDLILEAGPDQASGVTKHLTALLLAVGAPPSLGMLLAIFLGVHVIRSAVQSLSGYVVLRARSVLVRDLMRGTFRDCLDARWSFFTSREQGALLNLFLREMMRLGDALSGLARIATGAVQVAVYIVIPLYVSWELTAISVAAGLLLAWPLTALGHVSYRLGQRSVEASGALASVFQETFGAVKAVLAFGNQRHPLAGFDRSFDRFQRSDVRAGALSVLIASLYHPLGLGVVALSLLLARQLQVPMSETAVVLYSLLRVFGVMGPIFAEKNMIDAFFPGYEGVIEVGRQARQERQSTGSRPFEGFQREIALSNVSFAHPGRQPTLMDINAHVRKGKFVAFVGQSGAGKSTLVDLLIGLHVPDVGHVTIDGTSLSDFDIASYRHRLGYVPQEPTLFNMSIRDNIRWAGEHATDEDVTEACRLANAVEFIEQLPDGYDTIVGDRGVRLSGGQVQRIALARAMVRKPDLLILDEATSALDSASEQLIQQAIEGIARNTTVVAIAHRLSTITNADQIYVLSEGRIVEQGSYGTLLKRDGAFGRMARLQSLAVSL